MSSVVASLDKNLWLVENLGGGDCLLYSFLGPIFTTANMADKYSIGKQQYVVWFRKKLDKFCRKLKISAQDKRDANRELSHPHEAIVTTLIPYIGLYCNLSVILIVTDDNESGLYVLDNDNSRYWIIIHYSGGHYRSVVHKQGDTYISLHHADSKLIEKLKDEDFTLITPAPTNNYVLSEEIAYHST